ncbi:hypothetical protein HJC23_011542 [Cyclotella cryptica]|uniref:CTP synthase N-terminal domain-containing protein n=1 Tax=Cyclotella cryptica TaxID=29204 RepID=A0ABD3PWA3_9STRA|eukprot:CCRYP_011542-RA/>CCRYP_011542-RA protein AED:0.34 eAED:-0.10 QI:0/-1/0/1/-1/1/1/0/158
MLIPMPTFPPILSFLLHLYSPVSVTSFLPPPTTSHHNLPPPSRNSPPFHRPPPPSPPTPFNPVGNLSLSPVASSPVSAKASYRLFHRYPLPCYEFSCSIEMDPSLNVGRDHESLRAGEVFVFEDGGVTDLDLCNYERFLLSLSLTKESNLSAGRYVRV